MGRRRRKYEEEDEEDWDEEEEEEESRPKGLLLRQFLLGLSGLIAAGLIYCYHAQPDELAGLTILPAWSWLMPATISLIWFGGRTHKAFTLMVLGLWSLFTYTTVEEAHSLLRREEFEKVTWTAARDEGSALRVVSLNCNDGSVETAAEVKGLDPDVVLLQEPPSREDVEQLAQELFAGSGGVVWNPDAAIIARGTVQAKQADESAFFVHATIGLPQGRQIEVVNVRLAPPVVQYDVWSGSYWKTHTETRYERREQIRTVMSQLGSAPATTATIVGGDFGAAAEEGSLLALRGALTDSFSRAGHGWGNSAMNGYPLERVDQIWISRDLKAEYVTAKKSVNSDHRVVVSHLKFRQ